MFDLSELFRTLDAERARRGMTWKALSREIGVSTSTIRRFEHAADAEADGVLAAMAWLGVVPERFVLADSVAGVSLTRPDRGFVRVDMELVARANGELGGAKGRTRTTIQRLVDVAVRSGQPVAALTRVSDV